MPCVRCSQPLPPRADRCLRCFALNPGNHPGAFLQALHDSGPAAPVAMSIKSDPPTAPVAISFDDDPFPHAAITLPDARPPARRESEPERASESEPERASEPEPARPPEPRRRPLRDRDVLATGTSRLLAWFLDAAAIFALTGACMALALHKGHIRYPLDFLRDTAALWLALLTTLFLAYSFIFTSLAARTPGMALFGQRLRSLRGGPPSPTEALARAILSLPSAALGLLGFALALFDASGQTLHDKLCGCVVTID